jgi:hypothetical protein
MIRCSFFAQLFYAEPLSAQMPLPTAGRFVKH